MYTRTSAFQSQEVLLQMRFKVTTTAGPQFIDPNTVTITITDSEDVEIEAGLVPDKVGTGIYQLAYTVPSDGEPGAWTDTWYADFGNGDVEYEGSFQVYEFAPSATTSTLNENTKYTVVLSENIKDIDGNELGSEYKIFFYTIFDPMYSTLEDLKAILGSVFTTIPSDYVITYHIYRASVMAQALSFCTSTILAIHQTLLDRARREYVNNMVLLKMLEPIAHDLGGSSRKRLGDADISKSSSSTVIANTIKDLKDNIKRWERVIRSCGKYIDDIPPEVIDMFVNSEEMIVPGRLPYIESTGIPLNTNYYFPEINRVRRGSSWTTDPYTLT